MMEVGAVIAKDGTVIRWHLSSGCASASIPDTRSLWDVLWENRERVAGFAHSHPGSGVPSPSHTDLTTFAAIEAGLGRRLDWWITSDDAVVHVAWYKGSGMYVVTALLKEQEPSWAVTLRHLSVNEAARAVTQLPGFHLDLQNNCEQEMTLAELFAALRDAPPWTPELLITHADKIKLLYDDRGCMLVTDSIEVPL